MSQPNNKSDQLPTSLVLILTTTVVLLVCIGGVISIRRPKPEDLPDEESAEVEADESETEEASTDESEKALENSSVDLEANPLQELADHLSVLPKDSGAIRQSLDKVVELLQSLQGHNGRMAKGQSTQTEKLESIAIQIAALMDRKDDDIY